MFIREWARGDFTIERSLPFGLYEGAAQVGFARVLTDGEFRVDEDGELLLTGLRGRELERLGPS